MRVGGWEGIWSFQGCTKNQCKCVAGHGLSKTPKNNTTQSLNINILWYCGLPGSGPLVVSEKRTEYIVTQNIAVSWACGVTAKFLRVATWSYLIYSMSRNKIDGLMEMYHQKKGREGVSFQFYWARSPLQDEVGNMTCWVFLSYAFSIPSINLNISERRPWSRKRSPKFSICCLLSWFFYPRFHVRESGSTFIDLHSDAESPPPSYPRL